MNRCCVPTKGLSPPNMSPQPSSMKPRDETAKTMKFLDRMLTVFFALARPASTEANPRFMKNTRIAASRTQKVSIITVISTILSSLAAAAGRPSNDEGASPLGFAPLRTREGRRGYIRSALASWTQNSLFCRHCQPLGPFFMTCAKSGPVFLSFLQDFI